MPGRIHFHGKGRNKKMYYHRDMVPERFWMYAHKIEALPLNRVWIVDEGGRFQMDVVWTEYSVHHRDRRLIRLRPKQIGIPWSGEVKEPDKKRRVEGKWRRRCVKLAELLIEHGVVKGYADLAELMGLSDSYVWKLLKSSEEEDEAPPDEAQEDEVAPDSRFSIPKQVDES